MTNYLVYSIVALKWNRKIQCEILVGESVLLYVWCGTWKRCSHTSFFSNTSLPASNNFSTKSQFSTKSDAFLSTNILLSLIIFFNILYSISKIALSRYRRVSYKKLNGWELGHWLITYITFPAVTWKNIVWSISMPLRYNEHLPGKSASIIIAFELFGMFVSTRTPSVFSGEGKLCLFSK